jgi:transposase
MSNLIFVGVDVDDNQYTVFVLHQQTGECQNFRTRPTASALIEHFDKVSKNKERFRICYESTYLAFSLQRLLQENGYHCEVVASSLIPDRPGRQRKTDRLDAENLARYYLSGHLTIVHPPDPEDESVRDLLRSRELIVGQLTELKNHIVGYCRRRGWDFKQETRYKTAWTKEYVTWLERRYKASSESAVKENLGLLLKRYEYTVSLIKEYDEKILLFSQEKRWKEKVTSLTCFRGFSTLAAMTVITELGDVKRFKHPRSLTSYVGLDITEYSSGGKEKKFGISKMGNRRIRTVLIEASQSAMRSPQVSQKLRRRREGANFAQIDIADRCMRRLAKKSRAMMMRGKHTNKIKAACAREMLGFLWESLTKAS